MSTKMVPMFSRLNNKKGSSLLGVLVAGVISGMVGIGTYHMITAQIKAQSLIAARSEKSVLKAQIQGILNDPKLCGTTLKDSLGNTARFNPDNLLPLLPTALAISTHKKENSLSKIAVSGMVLSEDGMGNGSFVVIKHSLQELDKPLRSNVTVNGIPAKRIIAQLKIDVGLKSAKGLPTASGLMEFPISVAVNDTPTANRYEILECGSTGSITSAPPPAPPTPPSTINCLTIKVPFKPDETSRLQRCPSSHPYFSGIWVSQETVGKDSDKLTKIECCS